MYTKITTFRTGPPTRTPGDAGVLGVIADGSVRPEVVTYRVVARAAA